MFLFVNQLYTVLLYLSIGCIAKAHNSDYPVHRILDSVGNITAHIPNQLKKLEAEDIQVINETYISLQIYQWDDPTIYLD